MMKDNLLNNFYEHALGLKETNYFLGRVVGQIAHRYPQMNVLEIGMSAQMHMVQYPYLSDTSCQGRGPEQVLLASNIR